MCKNNSPNPKKVPGHNYKALLTTLVIAGFPDIAHTQMVPLSENLTAAQLELRCSQLIAFYDRFGIGRSQNSDGRRNHHIIGAAVDCAKGRWLEGVQSLEHLLRNKKFSSPPPNPDPTEPYLGLQGFFPNGRWKQ